MKKLILLPLCLLAFNAFAQRGYVEDAMYDKYGKDGEHKGNDWINNNLLGGKTESEYTFPVSLTMHMTTYKDGDKKDETDVKYYIDAKSGNYATEMENTKRKNSEKTFMIYDIKNHVMIMLDQKKMTGMAVNINAFMSKEMQERRDNATVKGDSKSSNDCKRTGKTQKINGYDCFEYVCTDKDRNRHSEMWIASKLAIDISQSGARGPFASYFADTKGVGGMLMLGKFYKNEHLESTMEVTNIDANANMKVKMSDYKMNGR